MTKKQDCPPVLYADQPAELSLGPFVSKLTLGIVENRSDAPIPVLSFAMPTVALLQMAKDIVQQIEDPLFAEGAARSLASAADRLAPGISNVDSVPRPKDGGAPRRATKTQPAASRRAVSRK